MTMALTGLGTLASRDCRPPARASFVTPSSRLKHGMGGGLAGEDQELRAGPARSAARRTAGRRRFRPGWGRGCRAGASKSCLKSICWFSVQPDLGQHAVEQLARAANKRLALFVLFLARGLADQQHLGVDRRRREKTVLRAVGFRAQPSNPSTAARSSATEPAAAASARALSTGLRVALGALRLRDGAGFRQARGGSAARSRPWGAANTASDFLHIHAGARQKASSARAAGR